MNEQDQHWCHEWIVNQRVLQRNKIICSKYPDLPIEYLAKKYYVTPLYILFILKRAKQDLLLEHENMIKSYVNDDFPFPEENNGYIYKICNKIDDMVYIGQTNQSLLMRWGQHKREYQESIYAGRKLHQHFCLIGIDNFYIELIEEVPLKDLNEREIYWIDYYGSYEYGLNGTPGGEYSRQEFF